MVILLYIRTLRRGEKLTFSFKNTFLALAILTRISLLLDRNVLRLAFYNTRDVRFFYKSPLSGTMLLFILFLLITLFTVVKLSETFKGALIKLK